MNDLSHDGIWKRQEIESPCVKLCVIHPDSRLCLGCARSLDEIAGWSQMDPATRAAIMAELPQRDPGPKGRRGGRARRTGGDAG